jgi:glucosamine-phosphate N-acetyltransferase
MEYQQYKIRELSYIDYHNKYLELLQQHFTIVPSDISIQSFTEFVKSLGLNHQIFVIEKVIEERTIIIGSITVIIEQKLIRSMGKVAHIEEMITHEDYRGQHIAKQLLNHVKEYARQNACYKVSLNCKPNMVRFYERNEFMNNGNQMVIYL